MHRFAIEAFGEPAAIGLPDQVVGPLEAVLVEGVGIGVVELAV